jgi:predicted nuclease with TOPRIM domain
VKDSVAALRVEMKDGFASIDRRFVGLEGRVEGLNGKVESLNIRFGGLDSRVEGLDSKVEGLEGKVDGLNGKVESLNIRFDGLDRKIDSTAEQLGKKIEDASARAAEHAEILFDRKFFRATGVIIGAAPVLYGAATVLQATSLGVASIATVAIGIGILIWIIPLLVTRKPRAVPSR